MPFTEFIEFPLRLPLAKSDLNILISVWQISKRIRCRIRNRRNVQQIEMKSNKIVFICTLSGLTLPLTHTHSHSHTHTHTLEHMCVHNEKEATFCLFILGTFAVTISNSFGQRGSKLGNSSAESALPGFGLKRMDVHGNREIERGR